MKFQAIVRIVEPCGNGSFDKYRVIKNKPTHSWTDCIVFLTEARHYRRYKGEGSFPELEKHTLPYLEQLADENNTVKYTIIEVY